MSHDASAYTRPMAWTWTYTMNPTMTLTVSTDSDCPVAPSFPSQADAESWIGEAWRELLDAGVDSVALLEDERVVYGGMSLHPADPG